MYLYTKEGRRYIDTEGIEKYVSRNVYMAWGDGRERRGALGKGKNQRKV